MGSQKLMLNELGIEQKENGYSMKRVKALELWCHALSAYVREEAKSLTARQQAILMTVALTDGPHTVRGLGAHLNIPGSAVVRSIDKLEDLGYLKRIEDLYDLRNVYIEYTPEGVRWLQKFGDRILKAEKHNNEILGTEEALL